MLVHGQWSRDWHPVHSSDANGRFIRLSSGGRATVPVLWDKRGQTVVYNESADILQILSRGFGALADDAVDLRPEPPEAEIGPVNRRLYDDFNNGVYQAEFAASQNACEEAAHRVFSALDWLALRLAHSHWPVGDRLTEIDLRAFVTLVRFDQARYSLFTCNLRPLSSYPCMLAYLRRLLALPALAARVNAEYSKTRYCAIKSLNPSGVVPAKPQLDYLGALGDGSSVTDTSSESAMACQSA